MNYVKVTINLVTEKQKDILIAYLADVGFESFEETDTNLFAFIPESSFTVANVDSIVKQMELHYSTSIIPQQNWNAQWESSFEPVVVNAFAAIRASFHLPVKDVQHEIIITPKMSFGTGHHATTFLMMEQMSHIDFNNKSVLDFGTGTGVLAILAEKMGAAKVLAIDNDDWSIENAIENCKQNNCVKIDINKAEAVAVDYSYDIILANINLNIISANMQAIKAATKPGGIILLSGFLNTDMQSIKQSLSANKLIYNSSTEKNNWLCINAINT